MRYVAFDTETTGIEPGSRLVELAAIAFNPDDAIVDPIVWMVNPKMPLPPDASKVNNITDEMLAGAPTAGEVLQDFLAWLPAGATLIAHNAPFDCGIVAWELGRAGLIMRPTQVIDTLAMARAIRATPNNKLETLIEHYGIQRLGEGHRALSDADACRQYFLTSALEAAPFPWSAGYAYTDDFPPLLAELPELVANGTDLTFAYQDVKGEVTERTITPYGWALTPSGLTFHGMCKLRGERRTFRADRIVVH